MIDAIRLKILTDGAKYDVSCSSSGSQRKNTSGGIGNAEAPGCCHSFTADGRCVSLLKILMTNNCCFDCQYCVNRRSNDVPRASATPEEICELVMSFYKRNYIEGLFLSSAIENSPDDTMLLLTRTVVMLRKKYNFNGYIHLKGIPYADYKLVMQAASYADRMSYNIELPSERGLKLLAPQKNKTSILQPMGYLRDTVLEQSKSRFKKYIPAGQTTQMIVGATPDSDKQILLLSQALYRNYKLKRVYYSSYVPANDKSQFLPQKPVGLLREHRLYQADWLVRFYGFTAEEIVGDNDSLDLGYDPKCAWAIRHMSYFPLEINTADVEALLRVPGIGLKSAYKIVTARRYTKLDFNDLMRMRVVLKRAVHFITCGGKFMGLGNLTALNNAMLLAADSESSEQLSMFSNGEIALSAVTGEL